MYDVKIEKGYYISGSSSSSYRSSYKISSVLFFNFIVPYSYLMCILFSRIKPIYLSVSVFVCHFVCLYISLCLFVSQSLYVPLSLTLSISVFLSLSRSVSTSSLTFPLKPCVRLGCHCVRLLITSV